MTVRLRLHLMHSQIRRVNTRFGRLKAVGAGVVLVRCRNLAHARWRSGRDPLDGSANVFLGTYRGGHGVHTFGSSSFILDRQSNGTADDEQKNAKAPMMSVMATTERGLRF